MLYRDTRRPAVPTAITLLGLFSALGVTVALTLLKTYFQIGQLWYTERQQVRVLETRPLDMLRDAWVGERSWFNAIFETAGNIGLFIPLGLICFVLLATRTGRLKKLFRFRVAWVTLFGFVLSATIEATQYVFAVGRTDVDDLICNTVGALLGALLAKWGSPRLYFLWPWVGVIAAGIFTALVLIY